MARSWNSENASSSEGDKQGDVEKGPAAVSYVQETGEVQTNLVGPRFIWSKISSWGVETRGLFINCLNCISRLAYLIGIEPVPIEARTQENYASIFTFFWTMNFCLLS